MKILFTGASSFTGAWFVRELASAGHRVTATFRRRPEEYEEPIRRARVALAAERCEPVYGLSFGDPRFLELAGRGGWDLLAHHASEVANYRSPGFDVAGALRANTQGLPEVLAALASGGCRRVLLTGSVFEGGEGAGSDAVPHLSPYGLSKALTAEVFRFHCRRAGFALAKFVIPNPFGPYEEERYTAYLLRSWLAGATPSCKTPQYVRDNVHVSLLARAYARLAEGMSGAPGFTRSNPSGYVESQGAFTIRLAEAMSPRLGVPCPVRLEPQLDFAEPRIRINTDPLDAGVLGWDECAAWDEYAAHWRERLGAGASR